MAAMTYLVRHPKTGVYSFRRAVPNELRTIVGRTAIKKSLGTKDVSEAKRRAHSVAATVEAEFEKARKLLGAPPRSELSDDETERLAEMYLHTLLEQDDAKRIHGTREDDDLYRTLRAQVLAMGGTARWSDDDATASIGLSNRAYTKMAETFDIVLPGLREKLARGDTTIVADEVDAFLESCGINLDKASGAYRKLSFAFLRASVKATEVMVKRHNGDPVETPPAPAAPVIGGATVPAKDGLDLQTLFDKWLEERKPPRKTVLDFTTAVRRFTEQHGNLPVYEITKPHVRAYKSALLRLPRTLSGELRRMTMPQLLEHLDKSPAPAGTTLRAGSINKAIGALQTIFRWVSNQGYLDEHSNWSNPAADMKVHDPAEEEETVFPTTLKTSS